MHFMYSSTKKQLIKRVLELEKEKEEIKNTSLLIHEAYKSAFKSYKSASKQVQIRNDKIRYLEQQLEHEQDAANGYKKAYNELKEKKAKEVNFTINEINADVWKLIRSEALQKTHKCTKRCFVEHVMPAIQRDYDSINPKYKEDNKTINAFLIHWEKRLSENYDFIHYLYVNFDGEVKAIFKI